ncbi:MAG: hypothetical protein QOK37_4612 [Thermoanaerobaculia bacterium]|jgi:hypothetical protein|nr:hypothetical protein [Thermoanaerobaculia bacterium]
MRTATILVAAMLLAAPAAQADRRFTSKACKCSFIVPPGWKVVANPEAKIESLGRNRVVPRCAFGLIPTGWPEKYARGEERDFGRYAIEVWVLRETFRQAAHEAFFEQVGTLRTAWRAPDFEPEKRASDWILQGRQGGRSDAVPIHGQGWRGLTGTAAIGYYAKGGGYRGMDDAYRAVISTGHRRASVIMADNPFTHKAFRRLVLSFRFE